MKHDTRKLILAGAALALAGCNMGMAVDGGSAQDIKNRFQSMDPQAQIKVIQGSPASPEKKAELIKAIEDKYHITAGATPVAGGSQSNPAGAPRSAPPVGGG